LLIERLELKWEKVGLKRLQEKISKKSDEVVPHHEEELIIKEVYETV
jgi:hypothetical protein